MNPELPNLFLAGVQKGGTTALAQFLGSHPEIGLAAGKEAHVLDRADIGQWSAGRIAKRYARHFEGCGEVRYRLDATPIYCYYPPALEAIARVQPQARLIVLLRDPVERAVSHYRMEFGRGNERRGALAAFALEPWRLWREAQSGTVLGPARRVASYVDRGRYRRQLQQLLNHFPPEQVLVLRSEALRRHHQAVLNQVFDWLGLARQTVPAQTVFAGQRGPKVGKIARALLRARLWREQGWLARAYPVNRPDQP